MNQLDRVGEKEELVEHGNLGEVPVADLDMVPVFILENRNKCYKRTILEVSSGGEVLEDMALNEQVRSS